MSDHARHQIRDAVVTLVTGLTTTGSNVWASRVYPMDDDNLPGLIVRTMDEPIAPGGSLGYRIRRMLSLEIEARVKAEETAAPLDEQLDTICAEVEAALGGSITLGGLAQSCALTRTRFAHAGSMERPVGIAVMTWMIAYYTLANDATTPLYL